MNIKTKAKSKDKSHTLRKSNKQTDNTKIKHEQYRGAFYNDTSEKDYYEFGAHFSYKELYNRLTILKTLQSKEELIKRMFYNQKDLLKKNNIKLKITRNISKPQSNRKHLTNNKNLSTINVIHNNNINLTNLNVNLNLNFNNNYDDSSSSSLILEKLNQIEQTVLNNAKMNSFLSRNNKVQHCYNHNVNCSGFENNKNNNCNNGNKNYYYHHKDYNSYFNSNKENHRNLTLYNAIKNMNLNKKGNNEGISENMKQNKLLISSVRAISKEKVCEKKRAASSSFSKNRMKLGNYQKGGG